jgi:hypothetical protein
MEVLVKYPVTTAQGVCRYETQALGATIEQIAHTLEGIEFELTSDNNAVYICVKSNADAEKIMMTEKATINETKPDSIDILNVIAECSGICGLDMYETLPLNEFIKWFENDISYNTEESRKRGEELIETLLLEQIEKEMRQAQINTWCLAHGINPKCVTYENGKICIPFKC